MSAHSFGAAGRLPLIALIAGAALISACSKQGVAAANPDEKRYPVTGEIVSVDTQRHVLGVHHSAIPGVMESMTMEFLVSPGDAANAKVGNHIRGDMVVTKAGDLRMEKIWPDDPSASATVTSAAKSLRQDTLIRGKGAYREVGESMPDFVLYDQSGKVVQSSRFRGKQIMLNFIYTRCPIATMCPAATLKMMETQKLAREAGISNVELVSITMDTANDTPGTLKDYADVRGIDTSNFSFLTGPDPAIKDILTQFGVIADFTGDIAKHTLATLLIDENGRIGFRADGSVWEPKDFVAKMHR